MKYRITGSFAGPVGSFRRGQELDESELPNGVKDDWIECGMLEPVDAPPTRAKAAEKAVKPKAKARKRKKAESK